MLQEKLGLCPYRVICDEQDFILPEIQDDTEELKKENEESMKIKSLEDSSEKAIEIKSSEESTEGPAEIKSPEEDENTTDWYDKNKLKNISYC